MVHEMAAPQNPASASKPKTAEFLGDHFLLTTQTAQTLYHNFAKQMPIIDYHCHLSSQEIFEDRPYNNLTELWLGSAKAGGDHYKWRLMRAEGIDEELITGSADPYERFLAYVQTIERALGNPLYEWSHLELKRYFGVDLTLTKANASAIWDQVNQRIVAEKTSPRKLLQAMQVEVVCTTDDPADTLIWHSKLAEEHAASFTTRVLPTFRPDAAMRIADAGFAAYIKKLSDISGITINSFATLVKALAARVDYFASVGGRLADHGLDRVYYQPVSEQVIEEIFQQGLAGNPLDHQAICSYQSMLNRELLACYAEHSWCVQLHMNVIRNANSAGMQQLGRDAGFDSVGDQEGLARSLVPLLDELKAADKLPKMILYSLSQNDWLALATLMQSFQGGDRQHMQFGCAWWFNDTARGMLNQLATFAEQSLLANFTGMLTDSRSFLSYPRHEYFRRVLCRLLGDLVEEGRLPADMQALGEVVQDICYRNARAYFNFYDGSKAYETID